MNIAENIKKARMNAGLSQAEMADMLGIKIRTYGSYERGERDVNTAFLKQFCTLLKISSSEILGTIDAPSPETPSEPYPPLTPREQEHLDMYRSLDDQGKDVIDYTLHAFTKK